MTKSPFFIIITQREEESLVLQTRYIAPAGQVARISIIMMGVFFALTRLFVPHYLSIKHKNSLSV